MNRSHLLAASRTAEDRAIQAERERVFKRVRRSSTAQARLALPSALVADDGTAPPVTDYQRGWEDGWCGTPSRIEGEEYAAGHADGSGCKRRREAVDRARICRVARS